MASDLETLTISGSPMSCQSPLPVSFTGEEVEEVEEEEDVEELEKVEEVEEVEEVEDVEEVEEEGLASPPWSVDSPEWCEEHGGRLSLFCLDDLEPLCQQCEAVSHEEHRVYLLTEAATDCKEELRTSLNGLKKRMGTSEEVIQTCVHAFRHNRTEAKVTEEHMKKEFESLHQFLRQEEAASLLALRVKKEQKKRQAEDRIDRMNEVIKSLEEKIQLVEEELDAGRDGVEFLEQYQETMNSREPQKVCDPLIDVAKHLGNLQYAVWEKMKHIAPYTPVTLDPRTAGPSLMVSPGLNSVHITSGPSQWLEHSLDVPVPANPERFHPYSSILAREGFDSGEHCWDVEVGDADNWTVGVATQSVRRTEFKACPEAGLWCISLRDGEYRALTTPPRDLNLDSSWHLSRVHVRLHWDEGMLVFMNADTETHLFTFTHPFTEKVYPYFESISSCGGLAVSAQSVGVSVEPDYVHVEETEEDQIIKNESSSEEGVNTAASADSSSEMSECRCPTEDKDSAISSITEEKKSKPQRCTSKERLIKTKPAGKEKAKGNKQRSKPRFSEIYHVSLNKAKLHQQSVCQSQANPDELLCLS